MYQVLARKYRPRNFSQLVGQTHVSRALSSALERNRLHHAYLFTGTRGVGKTTIARILAKCLNCETGVTATPCEQCTVCQSVNEGRFIDLIEIDAASRTRVEDTRELLDNVPYAPTQGRYKVYLIDEVHMLSTHSFNALLKTLEEPPEHVKFLFATTDPQKLPITVISRCLQFTLRPLGKDEIFQHLDHILTIEQIQHEAAALWQLAESAQGSLRDALSLTDQAIAYGQGQVLANDVKDMLGLIDKTLIFNLMIAIHQNQRTQVAALIQEMRRQAIDVTHVLEQLISILHEIAVLQCLPTSQQQTQDEQYQQQLAQSIHPQDLQLYYQICIQGRADLALALTPEQGFEMCIMRLLAFRPIASGEVVNAASTQHINTPSMMETVTTATMPQPKIGNIEQPTMLVATAKNEQEPSSEPMIHIATETPPIQNAGSLAEITDVATEDVEVQETVLENIPEMLQPEIQPIIVAIEAENNPSIITAQQQLQAQDDDVDPRQLLQSKVQDLTGQWTLEKWDYWLRQADLSPAAKEMAQHTLMQGEIAGQSVLVIDPSHQRIIEPFIETLKTQLTQCNENLTLELNYQSIQENTPLQLQHLRKQHAYQYAEQKIATHPAIAEMIAQFSAKVVDLKLKT
ncbi:MAG: DNA polymerase III subunit gamma/tau [Acinetobacter sp.]|jgi:DNA polymerase-3 subunit gamma/tau|nr:MAG: DNA polymerase III subunit gamma/tau [Acinetobacter sp.]